jgi:hypothetical protein
LLVALSLLPLPLLLLLLPLPPLLLMLAGQSRHNEASKDTAIEPTPAKCISIRGDGHDSAQVPAVEVVHADAVEVIRQCDCHALPIWPHDGQAVTLAVGVLASQ